MTTKKINPLVLAVVAIILASLACSTFTAEPTPLPPTDVPTQTQTPEPEPTATSTTKPTNTPRPTATPNLAATQAMEDVLAKVNTYVENGYLPSADGKLYPLDDFRRELAKMNYLDFDYAGYDELVRDFAIWADVAWENAGPVNYPQYSGCGFSFRIDPNNFDGYTAMLTNDRILLTFCDDSIGRCGEVGKTRGSGRLSMSNPADASMELIVNDTQAYVLVNGEFIGEYTLFTEKLLNPGYILYSMISGTNKDYGVRCEVTNANIWVVEP